MIVDLYLYAKVRKNIVKPKVSQNVWDICYFVVFLWQRKKLWIIIQNKGISRLLLIS